MSLIAQYIEDYLDLIENSPNEIIRQITRIHEKNHLYSNLNAKLEEMLKVLVDDESTMSKSNQKNSKNDNKQCDKTGELSSSSSSQSSTDHHQHQATKVPSNTANSDEKSTALCDKRTSDTKEKHDREEDEMTSLRKVKALDSVKRYLLEIQELADEKLNIVQSIIEHLDFKNKQLDLDYRGLSSQNANSNSNSSSQNTNDEDSLSGNQENSNNELNYQKDDQRSSNANVQSSNQSSSVNNHHSSNSKRVSSRRNIGTGATSGKQSELNNSELSSSHNGNSANNNANQSNNGASSSNHQKRGVKRGAGSSSNSGNSGNNVNKSSSNKELKRSRNSSAKDSANSPSNLYDEIPIDPDEPTYCICEQVSFGEMICCDNAACDIEWFHFTCVSLTTKPKGKWYCPNCRGDRSNIPKK